MNDRARGPESAQAVESTPPTISVTADCVVTGANFLPNHDVSIRVTYTADEVSDYLTYTTDDRGELYAELPTTPGSGALLIAATDRRTEPGGAWGLLWSNTETVSRS